MKLDPEQLRRRVIATTSEIDGRLEDVRYDLDARAAVILIKRQQISRSFGFTSLLSFATACVVSWQAFALTFQGGLANGGSSALVYGLLVSIVGSVATAASLAELTSMSPTSGGQYHWVTLLAPRRYGIVFSYFAGWITVFTRVATTAGVAFLTGTVIQGLAIFNYAAYEPQKWHGTLIYWAVVALLVGINIFGIRVLPHLETLALVINIASFIATLIPLVYLAPKSSAEYVFASFENSAGWSSDGVAWLIGMLTSTYSLAGQDGVSHMSEEVDNAGILVPRAMLWSTVVSCVLCFAYSIALLFCIGDPHLALNSPTGFPIIEVYYNATQSYSATNAMTSALIIAFVFCGVGTTASGSRLTWAFARDDGLPFSNYFAYVDRRYGIPVRALMSNAVVLVILGLINLGSTTAFNALISLTLLGQYTTYVMPTILLLVRRIKQDKHIPYGPWSMGWMGIPVNVLTIAFAAVTLGFGVLPPFFPVTADNFNYAPVVVGAALIVITLFWFLGRKEHYSGPIREVMLNGDVRSALVGHVIETKVHVDLKDESFGGMA